MKFDQDNTAGSCTTDWDKIDTYARTVRPPRALQKADAASVARGAALFGEPTATANNAACVRCHGGSGWTASRRAFTPSTTEPAAILSAAFAPPAFWPPASSTSGWNFHTTQAAAQPPSACSRRPSRPRRWRPTRSPACCATSAASAATPSRPASTRAGATVRAQGQLGYNVPSLYGMALGAPFFHNGKVDNLQELFDDAAWTAHATAGNPVWLSAGTAAEIAQRKVDLIEFLLSIDASTAEQSIPTGCDGCP